MKKNLKAVFIVCIIFFHANESASNYFFTQLKNNMGYGKPANVSIEEKKPAQDAQQGVSLENADRTADISPFTGLYFIMKVI
ncbi:MAG: hypothetical protein JWQ30_1776 [Sediminibacterium sp.]|nr:hypothetical protein [Sediminibacterium sp.]